MKISIIVPSYNANETIIDTLGSIISSTNRDNDYEIIVIDDGSDVPIEPILNNQFSKYITTGTIKYRYQANAGVSAARNAGLDLAIGEYITFCDADDLVSINYLTYLLELIEEDIDADIYEFSLTTFKGKKNETINKSSVTFSQKGLSDSSESLKNSIYAFTWLIMCRLVRSSLAKSVKFDENIRYCEDLIYLFNLYSKSKKVYNTGEYLYLYRMGHSSAITKVTVDECLVIKEFLDDRLDINNTEGKVLKAHLFYMFHSAYKRKESLIPFIKFLWSNRLSPLAVYKMHSDGLLNRRKFMTNLFPLLYYISFKVKK